MKNAHERFGFAEFEKRLKDTTTRIRLAADCYIGEPAERNVPSQGHLLSVFGTDVEVAALWAAILGEERIRIGGPELRSHVVQFGERPSVYRGTLTLPGRRRPIRHMVVASTQLRAEGDQARIIVKGNSPIWFCARRRTFTDCRCFRSGVTGSASVSTRPRVSGPCRD